MIAHFCDLLSPPGSSICSFVERWELTIGLTHTSVENKIAEILFAIEEGNECIAVIVGDVGSGKTLFLRLILDSLQPDRYRIAFITNPSMSFVQLLREIVGQITGNERVSKRKVTAPVSEFVLTRSI